MKLGIYQLSAEDYHADNTGDVPSLSCSIAKILLNQSPAHAWIAHPRLNPDYQDAEAASRMDIGTAAHALLLEGIDSVMVCDFDDWRKKDAQAMRDEARAAGKIPLLASQYADVVAMVKIATESANNAGFELSKGIPEQTVIWQEGETRIRTRPDWLSDDRKLILDYKTTALSSPAAWIRAIPSNGYDVQDALYRRSVKAVTGIEPDFVFMVQQNFEPYCCFFVELSESLKAIGDIKVKRAISMWRECIVKNQWHGFSQAIYEAEAMPWQLAEAEAMQYEMDNPDSSQIWTKEGFMFGRLP